MKNFWIRDKYFIFIRVWVVAGGGSFIPLLVYKPAVAKSVKKPTFWVKNFICAHTAQWVYTGVYFYHIIRLLDLFNATVEWQICATNTASRKFEFPNYFLVNVSGWYWVSFTFILTYLQIFAESKPDDYSWATESFLEKFREHPVDYSTSLKMCSWPDGSRPENLTTKTETQSWNWSPESR